MKHETGLSSVHDALINAVQVSEKKSQPLNAHTFKCDEDRLIHADQICARHGTSLSEFLRQCVSSLTSDYLPEDQA